MVELHWLNLGHVAAEVQRYTEYTTCHGLTSLAAPSVVGPSSLMAASSSSAMAATSSSAPVQGVIDLYDNNDSFNTWLDSLDD
jgi:hypothetical protein